MEELISEKTGSEKTGSEKIVIVVGNRHNPHAHHIKLEGTVRIGRALSSDVILSDEHVEPLQLVIYQQEGAYKVQVMSGVNPVLRNGEEVPAGIYDFVSGDEWSMGRTALQAFYESHVAEPTERLPMKEYRGGMLAQIGVFVATLLTLLCVILLVNWMGDYEPLQWNKKIAATLTDTNIVLVFMWATLWGVIGRVVAGRNQFIIHFVLASLFVFADILNITITGYLSYGTRYDLVWDAVYYIVIAVSVTLLLYSAFFYTFGFRRTKMIALMASILFSGFYYVDSILEDNELEPSFNYLLKPPFAILVEPQSLEQFRVTLDEVFAEVDEFAQ